MCEPNANDAQREQIGSDRLLQPPFTPTGPPNDRLTENRRSWSQLNILEAFARPAAYTQLS